MINRILVPGLILLISSVPGSALRTLVESLCKIFAKKFRLFVLKILTGNKILA